MSGSGEVFIAVDRLGNNLRLEPLASRRQLILRLFSVKRHSATVQAIEPCCRCRRAGEGGWTLPLGGLFLEAVGARRNKAGMKLRRFHSLLLLCVFLLVLLSPFVSVGCYVFGNGCKLHLSAFGVQVSVRQGLRYTWYLVFILVLKRGKRPQYCPMSVRGANTSRTGLSVFSCPVKRKVTWWKKSLEVKNK